MKEERKGSDQELNIDEVEDKYMYKWLSLREIIPRASTPSTNEDHDWAYQFLFVNRIVNTSRCQDPLPLPESDLPTFQTGVCEKLPPQP
jgi:hypothetical protein